MQSSQELNITAPDVPRSAARQQVDPEAWVATHGDHLYRHALARTGRETVAQDLVQETFLAAWKSAHRFAGRASERTWLLRILRNKIADYYRTQWREITLEDTEALAQFETHQFSGTLAGGKRWNSGNQPISWTDAGNTLERTEFWEILHSCVHKLPEQTARVFLRRELDGHSSKEICQELKISTSHLFVVLHRARLALRRCLELHWFKPQAHL